MIFDQIFDFLGIRIRLFENLNYPNRSESDFLISDDICIRLLGIRSFTNDKVDSFLPFFVLVFLIINLKRDQNSDGGGMFLSVFWIAKLRRQQWTHRVDFS